MDSYTISCTKEQTMKALELGAPIKFERKFRIELINNKKL